MAFFEQTRLTDSAGNIINPAKEQPLFGTSYPDDTPAQVVRTAPGSVDDQLVLLRRITKILENQQAVDPQQRQRIAIDSITAGVTLPTVTTVGTVTTVTGVTTVSTVTSVTNLAAIAGWNQQMFTDPARTAYNTGPRSQLVFTN